MTKKKLANLHEKEFTHPFDKRALDIVKNTPGINQFIAILWKQYLEKYLLIRLTSSAIKVNERNFPEIHRLFHEAREILDVPDNVDLYIQNSPELNAYTAGFNKPIICLHSSTIDILTPAELQCIIGHELGHIKCGHVLYHNTAAILAAVGTEIGNVIPGIGGLISTGIQVSLHHWHQMSEFSADRASLLVSQDYRVASGLMMKIAGAGYTYGREMDEVSFTEWEKQGEEFEAFDFEATLLYYKLLILYDPDHGSTHPFTVMRSQEMKRWIESGQYDQVLNRETVSTTGLVSSAICPQCGYWLSGNEKVCPICESLNGKTSHHELNTTCPQCSFVLDGTEQFCPDCGERLID